jgi:PleD family two-component response regulator
LKNRKILIADSPDAVQSIRNALGVGISLIACFRMEDAKEALSGKFDLIICGAHFDDCKMYDLLRYAKVTESAKSVPFLCMRVLEGELDDTLYQSVKIATKALGAVDFVDLFRWRRNFGGTEAFLKLRILVENLARSEVED